LYLTKFLNLNFKIHPNQIRNFFQGVVLIFNSPHFNSLASPQFIEYKDDFRITSFILLSENTLEENSKIMSF